MTHPIFYSYARQGNRDTVLAAYEAMGGAPAGCVFLDRDQIDYGDTFPEAILNALLDAQVAVLFLDESYFTRWYCLVEMSLAIAPLLKVAQGRGVQDQARLDAQRSVVLVLSPSVTPDHLLRFPSELRSVNWPHAGEPAALAALLARRLGEGGPTLRQQLDRLGGADAERRRALEVSRLPPPSDLSATPVWPANGLPPSLGEAFVGRTRELWQIHDALTRYSGYHRGGLVSVEAGAGFGKSRLAIEYVRRFGHEYAGGIFWMDAAQDVEEQHDGILRTLDPSAPPVATLRKRPGGVSAEFGRRMRAAAKRSRLLLVLDNLPTPEGQDAVAALNRWIPCLGDIPAVITTRGQVAALPGLTITPVHLQALESDAAVTLLRTALQHGGLTDEELLQVAAWVGNLPLALELLNRALRTGAVSGRRVMQAMREGSSTQLLEDAYRLLHYQVGSLGMRGVSQALSLTVETLTAHEVTAAMVLAQMAPQPIPEQLLDQWRPRFVFSARRRARLLARSVLSPVESATVPLYGSMHRVMMDYLRLRSRDITDPWWMRAALYLSGRHGNPMISSVLRNLHDFFKEEAVWRDKALAAAVLPHVEEAFQRACATLAPLDYWDEMLRLGAWAAHMLASLGAYARAQVMIERTLEGYRSRGVSEARLHYPLMVQARVLYELGDYSRAAEILSVVVPLLEKEHGRDDARTLSVLDLQIRNLLMWRKLREAEALGRESLQRCTAALGEADEHTVEAMVTFGLILQAQGRTRQAAAWKKKVLRARRERLGEKHWKTLESMADLARVMARKPGRGSVKLGETAYTTSVQELGEDHPTTLRAGRTYGALLRDSGRPQAALEVLHAVLQNGTRRYGRTHETTTSAAWELFRTLLLLGRTGEAHQFHTDELDWLLDCEEAALTSYQRGVRETLVPMTRLCRPPRARPAPA